MRCGRSTTAIGVQDDSKCYYRCFQRKGVWNSDLGGYDASVISFGVVKLCSTIGFSSLCLPLSNSSGLPHSNPIINVGETIGWILEEGIVDGLELPPAYVRNRVSSGLYCWYMDMWTYGMRPHVDIRATNFAHAKSVSCIHEKRLDT
ncbi:hypothetical protein EDC04DRAFT_2603258 [Pisolithus marmoratus]|nr:hypothetical protein EDC04DRAFT_2603258 [Pisolithus marmoratus]